MKCPFCGSKSLKTTNSRPTYDFTQTWRRKSCDRCHSTITTYEHSDMSWLNIKDPGHNKLEPYQKAKLYKSLLMTFDDEDITIINIENLINSIEQKIVSNQKTVITKNELIKIVLTTIKPISLKCYINYLSKYGKLDSKYELNRLIKSL